MSTNPFVALASDPVTTLAVLGYGLFLLSLATLSTAYVYRTVIQLYVWWGKQRPNKWEYVPPTNFILRAASVPFVLAVTVWALGGVVWLLA